MCGSAAQEALELVAAREAPELVADVEVPELVGWFLCLSAGAGQRGSMDCYFFPITSRACFEHARALYRATRPQASPYTLFHPGHPIEAESSVLHGLGTQHGGMLLAAWLLGTSCDHLCPRLQRQGAPCCPWATDHRATGAIRPCMLRFSLRLADGLLR